MDQNETYIRSGNVWLFADGTILPIVAGGDGPVENEDTALADLLASLTAEGIAGLSDDDLGNAESTLAAAIDDIDPATVTAEQLEALTAIDAAVTAVRAESGTRATQAAERATAAAELLARIRPPEVTDETPEGDAPDEPADADADTPANPVTVSAPETPAVTAETPAPVAEPVAVPIAAAGHPTAGPVTSIRPVGPPPSLGRANRRAGAAHRPAARATEQFAIVAGADVGGYTGGQRITVDQLDTAIGETVDSFGGQVSDVPGRPHRVATIRTNFPEARQFSDTDGRENERRMRDLVLTAGGLTASGGPCAAPAVDYTQSPIGSSARPLAGALTQVNGSRGAISYMQPPKIGDMSGSITPWTQANDITPGSDGAATKASPLITCGTYVTAKTEAIVQSYKIGNWMARNYAERVEALRRVAGVDFARYVESRHLTAIGVGSMKQPKTAVLGAARDVLTRIDLALAQARDQYRMDDSESIDVLAPRWLQDMMQADLTRELPGSYAERLATSDAEIQTFFAARGVNPQWLLDAEGGASFTAAANNVANRWPLIASIYIYPSGSWKLLDDGVLNLSVSGPYHDSVLNQTNDGQLWMEEFQGVYFQGTWSRRLDINVCPTGSTSATTNVVCNTGS